MNAPTPATAIAPNERAGRRAEVVAALSDALPAHALLWQRDAVGATQQLPWVSPARSGVFAARLAILSEGECNNKDSEEALSRAIAFAESALLAPPFSQPARVNTPAGKKARRRPRS